MCVLCVVICCAYICKCAYAKILYYMINFLQKDNNFNQMNPVIMFKVNSLFSVTKSVLL